MSDQFQISAALPFIPTEVWMDARTGLDVLGKSCQDSNPRSSKPLPSNLLGLLPHNRQKTGSKVKPYIAVALLNVAQDRNEYQAVLKTLMKDAYCKADTSFLDC